MSTPIILSSSAGKVEINSNDDSIGTKKGLKEGFRVKLYGNLCDLTGQMELELPLGADVRSLKEVLFLNYPQLKQTAFATAVNRQIVTDDHTLNSGDEIALLPPFSGG